MIGRKRWRQRGSCLLISCALGCAVSSCAGYRFTLPAGPGTAAPGAGAAWDEATRACRSVRSYTAALDVSGQVRGHGLPTLRVLTGATSDQGLYLDARYGAMRIFTIGGTTARATLLLHRDHLAITARADEILDAYIGLKIDALRWLALLTGCATTAPALQSAEQIKRQIVVTTADARAVLDKTSAGPWRIVGGEFDAMTVGYREFDGSGPAHWGLASAAPGPSDVRLDVRVHDVKIDDPSVTPGGFTVTAPADARVITLDELRAMRPVGDGGL